MSKSYPKSSRNTVKRVPKRGHYDQETIFSILDAGFLAHVGVSVDGQPFVIPTAYGRKDDTIYLHGATTSRLIKAGQEGILMCITVTHLDGIVLARSAFHHSMNYRSAVLFGTAQLVSDAEKEEALLVISEQILKGRWAESRLPNVKELKATSVLAFQIEEASAKIREGGPGDEPEDYALPIWAGVLPMQKVFGEPVPDEVLTKGIPVPESVKGILNKK